MFEQQQGAASERIRRRGFFAGALAALGALAWGVGKRRSPAPAERNKGMSVSVVDFSDSGERLGPVTTEKVVKTDEEWQRVLTRAQFHITRKADTEPPFSGQYWNHHEK